MTFIPVPGDDIVEVEAVTALPFKPAGEEISGKSQFIAIRCPGLDPLYCQGCHFRFGDHDDCSSRDICGRNGRGESVFSLAEGGSGGVLWISSQTA